MIIATAGHADHGKTTLVRALTGMDPDRLPEEQRRGMTLDLGFAHARFDGPPEDPRPQRIAFVDVPGHERFIRNLLAGVSAVHGALLVVAADDGPMPQTREHLLLLRLLQVPHLLVALTKADRASAERLHAVQAELRALLVASAAASDDPEPASPDPAHGWWTAPQAVPILPLDAPAGVGLKSLRLHLARLAHRLRGTDRAPGSAQADDTPFRLTIDRRFAVDGAGLVVTGTVLSGRVRAGDAVQVSPQGVVVRVRALQVQGEPAEAAAAGERCALNLAGPALKQADPQRGDWLLSPEAHAPTDRLDVRLQWLPGEPPGDRPDAQRTHADRPHADGPFADRPHPARPDAAHHPANRHPADRPRADRPRTGLQLHLGAAAIGARAVPLRPGWAQLVLDRPVHAAWGDRFILRDPAERRIGAGGWVVDPQPPARGRAQPARLAQLLALAIADPAEALTRLLALADDGVDLTAFARARNLGPQALSRLLAQVQRTTGADTFDTPQGPRAWTAVQRQALSDRVLQALGRWHADHPASPGPGEAELRRALGLPTAASAAAAPARAMLRATLARLIDAGRVVHQGAAHQGHTHQLLVSQGLVHQALAYRLPDHQPRLEAADQALLDRVLAVLTPAGLRPPIVGDLAQQLGEPLDALRDFLTRMARHGLLVQVASNRWFRPETVAELAAHALALAAKHPEGGCDAAAYRDRTGIGRNLTVQVLEHLDRVGVTRFDGRLHRPTR